MEPVYEVVRFFANYPGEEVVLATGLTLQEAQDRCSDPEGSSATATSPAGVKRTLECGPWFEGFRAETD